VELLRYNCEYLDAVPQDAALQALGDVIEAIARLQGFKQQLIKRAAEGTTPLDDTDKALLRKIFDVGAYIAKADHIERARLDRLVICPRGSSMSMI
jgi:hypothetical protein